MEKRIIVFGASTSEKSINKQFAIYAANQLENVVVEVLDLNDYEMPIYSAEKEEKHGIPQLAIEFKDKLKKANGFIISFAEHNGIFTSGYKNIYDWVSRINMDVWEQKPMLLLSTSPGERGANSVLNFAYDFYSYSNKNIIGKYSLGSFYENFESKEGLKNKEKQRELLELVHKFEAVI